MSDAIRQTVMQLTGLTSDRVRVEPRAPIAIQSHHLFDVWTDDGHWIAKQFAKPDEFGESPRREFDALTLLSGLDIAPQPIHFEPHTDTMPPVVIYRYLDGVMWDRRVPSAEELGQLAGVWLKMHSVTRNDLWLSRGSERSLQDMMADFLGRMNAYTDWAQAHYPSGTVIARRVLDLLRKREPVIAELEALPFTLAFCRSDERFANVIARPDGRLGMVDWEDCGLRDPAREVLDMLTHPNNEDLLSADEWQAFLAPYLAERTLDDPTLEQRIHLYMAIFPLFWLCGLLNWVVSRTGSGQPPLINEMPANERLRRYLARALAWPDGDLSAALADVADVTFFPGIDI